VFEVMKKRDISWLAVSFAGATIVFAQPPGERGPGGSPEGRPRPPFPMIDALDKNHDHMLSADEIKAATEALLTLDKNGDGELSEEEFMPPRPEGRGPEGRGPEGRGPEGRGPEGRGPEGRGPEGRGPEGRGPGGPEGRGPGGPEGRGPGGPQPPNPERFVEHAMEFDTNGDGMLDRAELMKFAEDMPNHRPGGQGRGPGGPEGRGPGGDRGPSERPRRPAAE